MKIGRITGSVVCDKKTSSLSGVSLLLLQPLDENYRGKGTPIVACDTVQAGTGDLVLYEGGREAALALDNWFNPSDASVVGIIDSLEDV
ncbi:MAG: ethanolamine utilization protein EutN [Spirochaetes bacterium]|nr:MAG: ethanolamine utilization protein EutN [Spirochaetota bacterium]